MSQVVAFLEEPTVVKAILTHLGLPAEPLPAVNAQAPPNRAFAARTDHHVDGEDALEQGGPVEAVRGTRR